MLVWGCFRSCHTLWILYSPGIFFCLDYFGFTTSWGCIPYSCGLVSSVPQCQKTDQKLGHTLHLPTLLLAPCTLELFNSSEREWYLLLSFLIQNWPPQSHLLFQTNQTDSWSLEIWTRKCQLAQSNAFSNLFCSNLFFCTISATLCLPSVLYSLASCYTWRKI